MKNYIGHLIYKTTGTSSFIGRFEIAGFEMRRSEYLLNSWLTSLFFNFGIKIRWSGKLWMVVSFIAYPLCLISEELFGMRDKGYTLIAEGE